MIKRIAIVGLLVAAGGSGLLAWALWGSEASRQKISPAVSPAKTDPNAGKSTIKESWSGLAIDSNDAINSELEVMRRKSPQEQAAERKVRLQAEIERLAAGDLPDPDVAQALYGSHWRTEVESYRKHKETQEILVTTAVVITGFGIITLIISLFVGLVRLIWKASHARKGTDNGEDLTSKTEDMADSPIRKEVLANDKCPLETAMKQRPTLDTGRIQIPTRDKVRVFVSPEDPAQGEFAPKYHRVFPSYEEVESPFSSSDAHMDNLMADEADVSLEILNGPIFDTPRMDPPSQTAPPPAPRSKVAVEIGPPSEVVSTPVIDLEQKIAEVSQKASEVKQQSDTDTDEVVNHTLSQLSDQISAIRQYAATQQDRVEKLQSGYDWNIIRTFCLRVIRCIDNLETRMDGCEDEALLDTLSNIHDELLFSLESSGVEQFSLELKSPFSGQERLAEAVKDKQSCSTKDLHGCVAEVVKPGYQYVIDEDNVKIVRTARVKLYRADEPSQ